MESDTHLTPYLVKGLIRRSRPKREAVLPYGHRRPVRQHSSFLPLVYAQRKPKFFDSFRHDCTDTFTRFPRAAHTIKPTGAVEEDSSAAKCRTGQAACPSSFL